ncbi:MAG: hypothetical protein U5P10_14710 [Spirochaetia bacterium]|nr:hypothetical protein [Spirochaetia bacterium]
MKVKILKHVVLPIFISVMFISCTSMVENGTMSRTQSTPASTPSAKNNAVSEKDEGSEELQSAQERIAELEAENKQLKEEIESLNQSPEVMFRKAVSLKEDDPQQAMRLLKEITVKFPLSEYSEPAQEELAALVKTTEEELKRVLSEKEIPAEARLQTIQITLDSYGSYLSDELVSRAEQEIEELQTEIKRTKYIRSRYDEMQEVTFHSSRRDTSTRTNRGYFSIDFYIVESDKTDSTYFRFRANYRGESWIFYKKITLLGSNGVKLEIEPDEYREKETEVETGGVREWSDSYLSDSYNDKILELAEAETVKVRFDGKYRIDFEMTEKQRAALKEIVSLYEHLSKG